MQKVNINEYRVQQAPKGRGLTRLHESEWPFRTLDGHSEAGVSPFQAKNSTRRFQTHSSRVCRRREADHQINLTSFGDR